MDVITKAPSAPAARQAGCLEDWLTAFSDSSFTLTMLLFNFALIFLVNQTADVVTLQNELMSAQSPVDANIWRLLSFISVVWFSMMCWWTAHFIFRKSHGALTPIEQIVSWCYGMTPGLLLLAAGLLRTELAVALLGGTVALLVGLLVPPRVIQILLKRKLRQLNIKLLSGKLKQLLPSRQRIAVLWLLFSFWGGVVLGLCFIFNVAGTAATLKAFVTIYFGIGSLLFGMTMLIYLLAGGTAIFRIWPESELSPAHRAIRRWLLSGLTIIQIALVLTLLTISLLHARYILAVALALLLVATTRLLVRHNAATNSNSVRYSWDQTALEVSLHLLGTLLLLAIVWQFHHVWVPVKAAWLAVLLLTCSVVIRSGGLSNWQWTGNFFQPPLRVLTSSIVLAILLAFVVPSDNHGVRRCLTAAPAELAFLQCPTTPNDDYQYAFASIDKAFQTFADQLPPARPSEKQPVFFVTSQGGGLRASYWSGSVLAHLQARVPNFHQHVFALAGVSGGSVGNTFYVATLPQSTDTGTSTTQANFVTAVQHRIGRDYLSPVTASFLNNDLMFRFAPVWLDPYQQDRATVLEKSWEQGFSCGDKSDFCRGPLAEDGEGLATPLQEFYRTQQNQWLPLLLSLGMQQESGSRLITAPFPVEPDTFPASYDVYEQMQCKTGAQLHCDIRLSTAALNAARFPYLTPAGSLNFDQRHRPPATQVWQCPELKYSEKTHIVDGGYYNNYGSDALLQLLKRLAPEFEKHRLQPVVLVLLNDPVQPAQSLQPNRTSPPPAASWLANEVTAPPQSVLSDRSGHGDASLTELQLYMQALEPTGKNFYAIAIPATAEYQTLPLGWWLSSKSKMLIDNLLCDADSTQVKQISEIAAKLPANQPYECRNTATFTTETALE